MTDNHTTLSPEQFKRVFKLDAGAYPREFELCKQAYALGYNRDCITTKNKAKPAALAQEVQDANA